MRIKIFIQGIPPIFPHNGASTFRYFITRIVIFFIIIYFFIFVFIF